MISFVIPCYKSAATLPAVVDEIQTTMQREKRDWELILVNDCSPDGGKTEQMIRRLAEEHGNITGVFLSRNFGQHAALMAGFQLVRGDMIICLDDDGQTPADETPKLIAALEDGYDVAYARYDVKKHSLFRNFGSRVNEAMASWLLEKPKSLYISSYFAMRRYVVDEIIKYRNPYPYVIGLVLRTTRNICNVDVHHRARTQGVSGYTLKKLLGLWLNGFTSFSVKPLRVATFSGVAFALLGFVYAIVTIVHKFTNPMVPVGWSSTICAILFIGGLLMTMMGMVGEYIGRIYISINDAPQYVVKDTCGGVNTAMGEK